MELVLLLTADSGEARGNFRRRNSVKVITNFPLNHIS